MAGTVNYLFDPNQEVYVIHSCDSKPYVTHGVVIRIRAEVLVTGTTLMYDIRLAGNAGTVAFAETDVFTDKAAAITAYDGRVA
jgi:hypothetical protein